jgi:hypothetical protein
MISRFLATATSGVCLNRKLKRLDIGILFDLELVSLISYIPVAIPAKNIIHKKLPELNICCFENVILILDNDLLN